jgi:trimeric autotransporter adhesin
MFKRLVSLTAILLVAAGLFLSGTPWQRAAADSSVEDGIEQMPYLVKDINQAKPAEVEDMVRMGNLLYMSGWDKDHGTELWVSDGTALGTRMLVDLNPGAASSYPSEFGVVGTTLYFNCLLPASGYELCKSDGTPGGTLLVKDIKASGDSDPINLQSLRGELYFSADTGANRQLWTSDGTAASTVALTPNNSNYFYRIGANSSYVFLWENVNMGMPDEDANLWVTDGTPAGTQLLREFNATTPYSPIDMSGLLNDTLYFAAFTDAEGFELWQSNGTLAGTSRVTDLNPGALSAIDAYNTWFLPYNGMLYFPARSSLTGEVDLWRTDGTAPGTQLVEDVDGSIKYATSAVSNGKLYFNVEDSDGEVDPYVSDGTPAGTFRLKEITPPGGYVPNMYTTSGAYTFFRASNGFTGYNLWRTDGTSDGTLMVKDINPGMAGSSFYPLTNLNGTVYFIGNTPESLLTPSVLWKSNGTPDGTVQVTDLVQGTAAASPGGFVRCNNTLFFAAKGGSTGRELYTSDGTLAGTQLVLDLAAGYADSNPTYLTCFNNQVVFKAGNGAWISDGTSAGTTLLRAYNATYEDTPGPFVESGGILYFPAGDEGPVLWRTDGTPGGTVRVNEPGIGVSSPRYLTPFNNQLLFSGYSVNGYELWITDGTSAGTTLVKDIFPDSNSSNPNNLTEYNGKVYFCAVPSMINSQWELWVTDGTPGGTQQFMELDPVNQDWCGQMYKAGAYLFFRGSNMGASYGLWVTDGTVGNTSLLYPTAVKPALPVEFNGELLFVPYTDGTDTGPIWKTDGTPAGTVRVGTPYPGGDPTITNLTVVGDTVYFTATNGLKGLELWQTDGIAEFEMVADLNFGAAGSNPSALYYDGTRLYFSADNGAIGSELWALKPALKLFISFVVDG